MSLTNQDSIQRISKADFACLLLRPHLVFLPKVVGMILSLSVTLFWLLLIPVTLYKLGDGTLFLAPDLVPKAQEQSQDRSQEDRGKSVSTTRKYSFTASRSRRSFSLGPSPLRGRRSRSRGVGEKMSQRDRSRET